MSKLFLLYIILCFVFGYGSSRNLPTSSFDEGYSHLFGNQNLIILRDRRSVQLILDQQTGSGFVSQNIYQYGFFSSSIKLPADYTAGVVVAFYMSNADKFPKNHDEIDFEFLGNIRGKDWRIQTNIYGNGSTNTGREERFNLWFDPSEDFHEYSILWSQSQIIFYIDGIPIREIKKTKAMGGDFPSKPMSLYATIWDGSDWATNGGKYKVNYQYAPYIAEFSNFILRGHSMDSADTILLPPLKHSSTADLISLPTRKKMENFRRNYMTYSYCFDRIRYKTPLPECVMDPEEGKRLRRADPLRFGGRRRGGRLHRLNIGGNKI